MAWLLTTKITHKGVKHKVALKNHHMYKKRIGNDIRVLALIRQKIGEVLSPFDMRGRNISVGLVNPRGVEMKIAEFDVTGDDGSILSFTFYGKDQRLVGVYTVVVRENNRDIDMRSVDKTMSFELVEHSYQEGTDNDGVITIEALEIEMEMAIGTKGDKGDKGDKMTYADLTEADKADLYEGGASLIRPLLDGKQDTISDLDAIRQGAEKGITALQSYTESDPVYTADKPNLALKSELDGKVDKEEGKGLSSNDYTDEEKAKLSELEKDINGNEGGTTIVEHFADITQGWKLFSLDIPFATGATITSVLKNGSPYSGTIYGSTSDNRSFSFNTANLPFDLESKDMVSIQMGETGLFVLTDEQTTPKKEGLKEKVEKLVADTEKSSNKVVSLDSPNDIQYPTTKAVADAIKEAIEWGKYDEVYVADGFIFYTPNREERIYKGVNILATNNILNIADIVRGKRCDDNGEVVSDTTEGYTENFIPVRPSFYLKANISGIIDNVYFYEQNYNFIKRKGNGVSISGKGLQLESNVYFVKLQIKLSVLDANPQAMVILHDGSDTPTFGSFVEFKSNKDGNVYEGEPNMVWTDGYAPFYYKAPKEKSDDVITREPLFADMSLWEPDDVDSGYSNPSSGYGQDTKREDWSASDKYMYYDFLAHYYDGYLGETDGYRVTRRSLCQDTAHTGHEIFEYDFCPKDYKCVVMLSAGMNADETQGIWGLATFIRCLMNEEEPMLAIAKKNIRFKVIPIINASGFDQPLLRYNYANGVNPNYNFNFKDSWEKQIKEGKGDYPDSNIETQALKKWINDNAGVAIWWHDIHTGKFGDTLNSTIMDLRFPTSVMYGNFNDTIAEAVCTYYKNKGFVDASKTKWDTAYAQSISLTNYDYSKHLYAYHICGIPNCMSEMHIESTGYGADGGTNNSTYGIKSYVLQIRILMMFMVNKWIGEHPSITLQDDKLGRLQQIFK